jgi:hypothetical protein
VWVRRGGEIQDGTNPEWRSHTCYTWTMTNEQKAYIAGIIDGEGWLGFTNKGRGHGRPQPQIQVSSCDSELIDWLKEACGGWNCKPIVRGGNRNIEYRWRIGGYKACALLAEIAPYLVINKRIARVAEFAEWAAA